MSASERLDWLRPELLDARWRSEPAPVAPAPPPPVAAVAEADDPLAWCARLGELAVARAGEGSPLARLVEELGRVAARRFAAAAGDADGAAAAATDAQALDARLEELIGWAEDLADAAALARRRP